MNFYVTAKSYNRYGGHTTLSRIGNFLMQDAPEFGDAIKEICVSLHFPHSGPAKKTLEQLLERHNSHRATLPKITYRRAKSMVEIEIASELIDGRDWKPSPRLSLTLFKRGVAEIVESLSLIRKRLKSSDEFDLDGFLSHCGAAVNRVPNTEVELQCLAAELEAAAQAKRDAMSAWEKLGIDWVDYHPRARDILDDPFYWELANQFSPNGNDTGADLLAAYRGWLKTKRNARPIQFLENLARQWGYAGVDEMDEEVRDEAAVALAFADIKLRGLCDVDARRLALGSIDRQRIQAESSTGWTHLEERLRALEKIGRKLKEVDESRMESTG